MYACKDVKQAAYNHCVLKLGLGPTVCDLDDKLSLVVRKPVFGVSDHVRHKPGCTATEDGLRLEISD